MLNLRQLITSDNNTGNLQAAIQANKFKTASSVDTDYIPLYNYYIAEYKSFKNFQFSVYGVPLEETFSYRTNTNKLVYFLSNITRGIPGIIYRKGSKNYTVLKHLIYELDSNGDMNILYTLAVKKEYIFQGIDFNNPDLSKFLILLDRKIELVENRPLFNILKKEVLVTLVESGINLMYTNSIEDICYNTSPQPYTFETLREKKEFLNNLNIKVLDGI